MARVDLDAWENAFQPLPNETPGPARRAVLDMVAELRAAREVVEAARFWDNEPAIASPLAAYDEAVTS